MFTCLHAHKFQFYMLACLYICMFAFCNFTCSYDCMFLCLHVYRISYANVLQYTIHRFSRHQLLDFEAFASLVNLVRTCKQANMHAHIHAHMHAHTHALVPCTHT